MGHCVGGYCDDVASRGTEIYSLRDKNNNPHVTVEVGGGSLDPMDWFYAQTPDLQDALHAKMGLEPTRTFANRVITESPEFQAALAQAPKSIVQIKGKQNAVPVEKYLPFVQDFVRSGQWGRVGDLANSGLHDVNSVSTLAELAKLAPTIPRDTRQYLRDEFRAANPDAKYISPKEVLDWAAQNPDKYGPSLLGYTPGYAAGGTVVPRYSAKAQLLARLR